MSNSLISLAIFTALAGGAFAAAFTSDPCASPCGDDASVRTTAVWNGGSDTGGCTLEEMVHRPTPGECSEKGCSLAATSPYDNGTCDPSDPADSKDCGDTHHSNDSKAACREVGGDELQDRRSGCIPHLPPNPPRPGVSLACYQDGRGDEPNSRWGNAYKPPYGYPSHDGCYDSSGDQLGHDDIGPCFDRWGNFIGVKTPYHNPALI
ncbi:MAG TPA: hypothetical protein DCQ33_11720 [Nitrospira sp.]|nr:hypothetical protein [Nitrospira sp.]